MITGKVHPTRPIHRSQALLNGSDDMTRRLDEQTVCSTRIITLRHEADNRSFQGPCKRSGREAPAIAEYRALGSRIFMRRLASRQLLAAAVDSVLPFVSDCKPNTDSVARRQG
jgi:hypothetical protein